jgi:hypothetical protein
VKTIRSLHHPNHNGERYEEYNSRVTQKAIEKGENRSYPIDTEAEKVQNKKLLKLNNIKVGQDDHLVAIERGCSP